MEARDVMGRFEDWDIVAIVLFIAIFFGGLFIVFILSEQATNETARQCIAAGFEWIDGNCVRR
ncbi:hypothetical protein [Streptomyces sp. CC53]|uniref:hypothetical protein n=1 Tax=Streptomyces sp. CC53 TaxID=1906740 RepID=UPI00115F7F55|nr:hypothetical protein [Streptomyces sp. CC53]